MRYEKRSEPGMGFLGSLIDLCTMLFLWGCVLAFALIWFGLIAAAFATGSIAGGFFLLIPTLLILWAAWRRR